MYRRTTACCAALVAAALSTACVPQAPASLDVAPAVPNAMLFECAESVIRDLHAVDGRWSRHVSLRDAAGGRLETGDFGDANVMGYRVRVTRPAGARAVSIEVRAAGPYFTDAGAQRALGMFTARLATCLGHV